MAKQVSEKEKLTEAKRFRLNKQDSGKWDAKIAESGLTQSEFIRQAVIDNQTRITARPRLSTEALESLHHIARMGSNLNQLAHQINVCMKEGTVTEETFINTLMQLKLIADSKAVIAE